MQSTLIARRLRNSPRTPSYLLVVQQHQYAQVPDGDAVGLPCRPDPMATALLDELWLPAASVRRYNGSVTSCNRGDTGCMAWNRVGSSSRSVTRSPTAPMSHCARRSGHGCAVVPKCRPSRRAMSVVIDGFPRTISLLPRGRISIGTARVRWVTLRPAMKSSAKTSPG